MRGLLDLPQHETERAIACGAPVFLSVNPVEYHGPHLPLHTDALISDGLNRALFERLAKDHPDWRYLNGGELEMGVEPTPGPGTRATPYRTVRAAVQRACESLHALGAQRVILMTFHGAPMHSLAIDAGVRWLRRRGVAALAPLNLILRLMLELSEAQADEFAPAFSMLDEEGQEALLRELATDFHAGYFETSILMHLHPQAVSPQHVKLPPCPKVQPVKGLLRMGGFAEKLGAVQLARELRLAALGLGWHALRPFPGYTGRPDLANPQAGRIFTEGLLDRFEASCKAVFFEDQAPPAPTMPWLKALTMGGLLGEPQMPADAILKIAL